MAKSCGCAEDICLPEACGVVHVEEVGHAPSVSELLGVAEARFREDATVTFVSEFWGRENPALQIYGEMG